MPLPPMAPPCACPPVSTHQHTQAATQGGLGQRETSANGPRSVPGHGPLLGQLCKAGTLATPAVWGSRPEWGPTATVPGGRAGPDHPLCLPQATYSARFPENDVGGPRAPHVPAPCRHALRWPLGITVPFPRRETEAWGGREPGRGQGGAHPRCGQLSVWDVL